jgi:hypothetical protein
MGGGDLIVPAAQLAQSSVLIELDSAVLRGPHTKLKVGIYSKGRLLETVNTSFVGPR